MATPACPGWPYIFRIISKYKWFLKEKTSQKRRNMGVGKDTILSLVDLHMTLTVSIQGRFRFCSPVHWQHRLSHSLIWELLTCI